MSFLSQMIRGEITCSTDPGVNVSVDEDDNAATVKLRPGESKPMHKKLMTRKLQSGELKSQARKIPGSGNKISEYLDGELDIFCFSPTIEDYSTDAVRSSAEGVAPRAEDNEMDDLVFVDIVDKKRMSPSIKSSLSYKNTSKSGTPTIQAMNNPVSKTKSSTKTYSGTDQKKNRLSPSSVITGFASPTALSRTDKAGNDFLKSLYDRDDNTFVSKQLKAGEADSRTETISPINHLRFESSGFSQAESLSIKRRIKLQSLIRSLDADLSKDS